MNLNYKLQLDSKLQLDNILFFCESKLKLLSNNTKINGFIVFLIHLLANFISFYFLFLHPLGITFYLIILIWIIILISNYYFHGCILTKLERKLWKNKKWNGLYFLYCDSFNHSISFLNNLFICNIILITTMLFLRILFKY